MFKHVLFDLDGTLTRSHVGILRSVEYALNREGESTVDGVCTIIFRNDTVR